MIEEDFRRPRRRNGEGSIYQRQKDGLWVGAAYVLTLGRRPSTEGSIHLVAQPRRQQR